MKTKLIFSPQLAQFLLHRGMTIVELKPKRNRVNETVFVFEYDQQMPFLITEWMTTNKSSK